MPLRVPQIVFRCISASGNDVIHLLIPILFPEGGDFINQLDQGVLQNVLRGPLVVEQIINLPIHQPVILLIQPGHKFPVRVVFNC